MRFFWADLSDLWNTSDVCLSHLSIHVWVTLSKVICFGLRGWTELIVYLTYLFCKQNRGWVSGVALSLWVKLLFWGTSEYAPSQSYLAVFFTCLWNSWLHMKQLNIGCFLSSPSEEMLELSAGAYCLYRTNCERNDTSHCFPTGSKLAINISNL